MILYFINQYNKTCVEVDFKPTVSEEALLEKIERKRTTAWTTHLRKQLNLTRAHIALIKWKTTKAEFQSAETVVSLLKCFKIEITGVAPIDEAISSVGGIDLTELTEHFELKKMSNAFVLGEMLDWDAPTGGYLIQGCMSMGQITANYLNSHFSN